MAKDLATTKPGRGGGKALAVLSQELAQLAQDESANIPASAGAFLSSKGKRFTFQDQALQDPLQVIIVDHALSNAFYPDGYDPNNPKSPDCWAVAKVEGELAPPADLDTKVSDSCTGCPNNVFGSADTGRGKACKNGRILAVLILAEDVRKITPKVIEDAPLAYLRLSPTALKPFNGYLKRITGQLSKPLFSVVTALRFDEAMEQPVVLPDFVGELTDEGAIRAIMTKREELQEELLAGYPKFDREEAPKGKGRKAPPQAKKVAKKAAPRKGKF